MTDHAQSFRRERRILHALVVVLALLIMAPFLWLLHMSFKL